MDFLINIFTEIGQNRNTLTNVAKEYLRNIDKPIRQRSEQHQGH